NRDQRDGLELDAPGPLLADLLEDGPADRRLRAHGIDMSPDGAGAVGPAAAQAEVHAAAHVLGGPVRGAVRGHRAERAVESAVRIRGAFPGVALVEVRVHVDEARPELAVPEIDGSLLVRSPARRHHAGDA